MKAIKSQHWSKEFGDHQRTDYLSENTEDDLKILLRILSIFQKKTYKTVSTIIHRRDQATYVWMTSDTIRIRSATSRHVIRRVTFSDD
jgi:hypothetical protein